MSDELSILLLDLAAALDVYSRDNPHVTAFETLEQSDGADAVLSSSAAEVWEEVLKIDPGDHLALHHLAVIHHGRGYQLHLAGGVKQLAAVASWRQALAAWESLLRHDEFWTELRAGWQRRDEQGRADKRRDMLAERLMLVDLGAFRRQLPGHLLSVQVSIFKDNYQSDPALAAQHVKLIRESGFEPKLINRLCDDLYATFVTATNELCAGFKFAEARQAVEGYLAVDPVHPAALRDMLQIAGQHYKRMKAEEPPVSLEQQRRALEESQPWADKLAVHGDPAHSIFDAKSLRDYYLALADVVWDLSIVAEKEKRWPVAAEIWEQVHVYARRGLEYERGGQQAWQLCRRACSEAILDDCIGQGAMRVAGRLVPFALEHYPDSAKLYASCALYYQRRGDRAAFRRELVEAQRINAAEDNPDVNSLLADIHQITDWSQEAMATAEKLTRARQALDSGDWQAALAQLSQAERGGADVPFFHALKAKCLVLEPRLDEAQESYRTARRLARGEVDPELRNLLSELAGILE